MSLLNALFGSKTKKERSGSSAFPAPQITSPPAKPEQDFVILQDSDFKISSQQSPYPNLSDLHIGPNGGIPPRPSHLDTLDRVPFKLSDRFKQKGDGTSRNLTRSLNDIGHRIDFYEYDFKVEDSVLRAQW